MCYKKENNEPWIKREIQFWMLNSKLEQAET